MNPLKRLLPGLLALALCAGLLLPHTVRAELPPGVVPPRVTEEPAPEAETPEAETPEAETPEKPTLIAHAGGAIYGFRLTNSLEALEEAYACGHRVIEVDLSLTEEGEIVLIHDWEEMALRLFGSAGRRTLADFKSAEVFQDLTLLSLADLLGWLREHPGCRIVTDVKEEDNVAVLRQLKEEAGEQAAAFIPQIYLPGDYDAVQALGFADIILTFYRMGAVDALFLQLFLKSHSLWAVTLPFERLESTLLQGLSAAGVAVYAHTVNTLSDYESWQDAGLYGIYTDYFRPDHWVVGQG